MADAQARVSVNQMLPSCPTARRLGQLPAVGTGNWTIAPLAVSKRPSAARACSVNQM